MEIFWLGHGCFRLRGRDATVVTDPCSPATGYKIGKVAADIVTLSGPDANIGNRAAITGTPKFLSGPGEYEIAGVLITALRTNHDPKSEERDHNVAFVMDIDDIRVCHLGQIRRPPSADDVEALGAADVLILPVGGGPVMGAAAAAETVSLLEPKLVIPMIYKTDVSTLPELDGVDKFLKEMGAESKTAEARLNLSKSSIPSDTTIMLLNYRG